jgi:hypothetical protein
MNYNRYNVGKNVLGPTITQPQPLRPSGPVCEETDLCKLKTFSHTSGSIKSNTISANSIKLTNNGLPIDIADTLDKSSAKINSIDNSMTMKHRSYDQKLGNYDQKLGNYDQKLSNHDQKLVSHDQRLSNHDQNYNNITDTMARTYDDLAGKINDTRIFLMQQISQHVPSPQAIQQIQQQIQPQMQQQIMQQVQEYANVLRQEQQRSLEQQKTQILSQINTMITNMINPIMTKVENHDSVIRNLLIADEQIMQGNATMFREQAAKNASYEQRLLTLEQKVSGIESLIRRNAVTWR